MTRYIQGSDGKFKGSIGDGKTNIPTADPANHPATTEEPVTPNYSGLYSQFAMLAATPTDEYEPPHMFEIMPQEIYEEDVALGFIKTQVHPTLPYTIHNYSKTAPWENHWTPATLTCRGLITHTETGVVLARPFRKFMNWNQAGAPEISLADEVVVFDKADGNLAILFPNPDGTYSIATRGSFTSPQADRANEKWKETYGDFEPNPRWTYCFEHLHPADRIVLRYDIQDLVLLGAIDTKTGRTVPLEEARKGWNGPVVETFPYRTFGEALTAPPRENAEGFVIWIPETDERVKIKEAEYVRLHKIISSASTLSVWEALSTGEDPVDKLADLPDEFFATIKSTMTDFTVKFETEKSSVETEYKELIAKIDSELGKGQWGRKEFAGYASKVPNRPLMFLLHDGRSIDQQVWNKFKPQGGILIAQDVSNNDVN